MNTFKIPTSTTNLQFILWDAASSSACGGMINNFLKAIVTLFEVIFWHLPGETNKNYGKPQFSCCATDHLKASQQHNCLRHFAQCTNFKNTVMLALL